MKATILLTLLLALSAQAAALQKSASQKATKEPKTEQRQYPNVEWTEFVSKAAGFSVLMPGSPKDDSKDADIRYKLDIGPRTFGVMRTGSFQRFSTPERTLTDMAVGFMEASGGKLLNRSNIKIDKYPGLSIKFDTPNPKGITEARFYLVDQQMYILIAFTKGTNSEDSAVKFLNSFRLLK